jgi:predicted  nucleic acid-binding Zn-ribbon protein
MSARYGYGPNGRALKKDGTERKERTTKTIKEKMAEIKAQKARVYGQAGKAIVSETEGFEEFSEGLSRIKARISEARRYSTAEKRENIRARLQAEIDSLESKGEIAAEYLAQAEDTIDTLDNLYSEIGERVMDGGEDAADVMDELISEEVSEIVEDANNPDSDPFANFKANANEDEEDTLD